MKSKNFNNVNLLLDLYVNKELSSLDCAKILNISKSTVLRYLHKKGVVRNKNKLRDEYGRFIKKNQTLPPHEGKNIWNYNNGSCSYRRKAFKYLPNKCHHCNIKTKYKLDVHHIDGNRNNNKLKNLRIVCRKCHLNKEHKVTRDHLGRFVSTKKKGS